MRTLFILFLIVISAISKPEKAIVKQGKPTFDTLLITLKKKRTTLDQYEYKHRKDIIFLVKLIGKKGLIKVKEDDWPDDSEYIYSILKDSAGKVMLIEQSPYSQSGDWYVEWKHYFDGNGNTFAFSKREQFLMKVLKVGSQWKSLLNITAKILK